MFVVLMCILGFIVGALVVFVFRLDFDELSGVLVSSVVVFVFIGLLVSGVVTNIAKTEIVTVEEIPIYSLQDNVSVDGRFFLGSGSVDSDLKYYCFVDGENGLKYKTIDADSVELKFDDNPRLVTYSKQVKSKAIRFWFFDSQGKYKVLYVPKDSVIKDININLN